MAYSWFITSNVKVKLSHQVTLILSEEVRSVARKWKTRRHSAWGLGDRVP